MQAVESVNHLLTLRIRGAVAPETGYKRLVSKKDLIDFSKLKYTHPNIETDKRLEVDFSKRHILVLVSNLPDDSEINDYQGWEQLDNKIRLIVERVIKKKEGIVKENKVELIFLNIDSTLVDKFSVTTYLPD